ncbi:MAG: hypothetical protein HY288_16600 [Planctomycetia bacterium]|nr:hypothetical protein [Planctomycetia bacterium]
MGNHPFNVTVVLFWLATMGWLVVAKILPPVLIGEPPNYSSILKATHAEPPVCWSIRLQDRVIGWAATKIAPRDDGITNLYSRVYLGEFPLDEIAPGWLAAVFKPVLQEFGPLDIDKKSRVVIDPLGRLVSFESRVRVADIPDAIKVEGQIEGTCLKLSVQSGEIPYKLERYLPQGSLVVDELSPQGRMPGLRVGQTWTVPLFSPFRPPSSPMEILQASVEQEERITWDGERVNCRVIVYRNDSGSGLAGNDNRGRVWVRDDGVVLRQEVSIFKSHLHFIRLPDNRSKEMWQAMGDGWTENWTEKLPSRLANGLLKQLNSDAP